MKTEKRKAWEKKNAERLRADSRAYYRANREKWSAYRKTYDAKYPGKREAAIKAWNAAHPERAAARHERNMSVLEQRAGRSRPAACEACGRASDRRLDFDHDHVTGEFRGWLCRHCNLALGHVSDDPCVLQNLIDYLAQQRHLKLV